VRLGYLSSFLAVAFVGFMDRGEIGMEPKSGGAILSVEWGNDLHEIVVSP
jgi:hypothetical protein